MKAQSQTLQFITDLKIHIWLHYVHLLVSVNEGKRHGWAGRSSISEINALQGSSSCDLLFQCSRDKIRDKELGCKRFAKIHPPHSKTLH